MNGLASELWTSPLANEVVHLREEIRTELRHSYGGVSREKNKGRGTDKGQDKDKEKSKGTGQNQDKDKGLTHQQDKNKSSKSHPLSVLPQDPSPSLNPPSAFQHTTMGPGGIGQGQGWEDPSMNSTNASGFNPLMGVTVHPQHTYVPTR